MNFKNWLLNEAIIDKKKFIEEINSTEYPYMYLQLSPDGKISMPDTLVNNGITIEKKHKSITATGSLQPLSKNFKNTISAIAKIYPEILDYVVSSTGIMGFRSTGDKKRSVKYWLEQERLEPTAHLPKYFYHGTSTNVYNLYIKKQGLLPRKLSGSGGSFGATARAISRDEFNYLTMHPDYATREAARQAANKHGGLALVIRIDSSAIDPNRLYPDEDSGATTWEESLKKIGTVAYKGIIPYSNIEPYEISKDKYGIEWSPYEETQTVDHPAYKELIRLKEHRHHDPIFFALYDAGIIDYKGKLISDLTNEEFYKIINGAKWATNAWLMHESISEGILSHLRNRVMSRKAFDKEVQKIITDLYQNKILNNYLELDSDYLYTSERKFNNIIEYAKQLGKQSWKSIEDKLKELYPPRYKDESDFLFSNEAKEILGIRDRID